MPVTKLANLLDGGAEQSLGRMIRHARDMGDLARSLRAALDEPEARHLLAANVRDDGSLVIICSSAAWAAKLRFESERLIGCARDAGVRVERLRVRVAASGHE